MKTGKRRLVPARKQNPYRPHLLAGAALLLLTLLAYSNSFDGGFILDNRALILNDPRLREASAANLGLIWRHTAWWPTGEGGVFRPLSTLSYLFNYSILGDRDQPAGYHWINYLIHATNAVLVYALAVRFIRRPWPSFFAAALWAVHPVLTEAVSNIVGRADLLAATGLLAGFLMYLKSAETNGRQRWLWLAGVVLFTTAGVFSKENAVVLPGAIVLYELTFRGRAIAKRVLPGLIATLIPTALMFYQRAAVLAASLPKEVPFTDNPILGAGFWAGRWTAADVLARYLWLMLWPARLSSDYSWSEIPIARGAFGDWIALLVVLALIPGVVILYRRNREAFFFVCLGLAWLAPVANVIFPIGSIMAERFLYVPVAAAAFCVVLAVYSASPRYAPVLLCVCLAALGTRTWVRNIDWRDELSMATASVEASPGSFKTHDLLANVLFASDPAHGNLSRVIEESEKSRAILDPLPDNRNLPDPYQFAGTCYLYRGDYPKAIAAFHRFLAIEKAQFAAFRRTLKPGGPSPKSAEGITAARQGDAYTSLSIAYLRSGDANSALDAARQARALNPVSPELYRQMSRIDVAQGKPDAAAAALIEGTFVTNDGSLRQDLLELYRQAGPGSCALRGSALNPACPMVHANLCAAAEPTVNTLESVGQSEQAADRRKMFVEQFGCK
jgi:tetratricopeptide (TPR) repeat protein